MSYDYFGDDECQTTQLFLCILVLVGALVCPKLVCAFAVFIVMAKLMR